MLSPQYADDKVGEIQSSIIPAPDQPVSGSDEEAVLENNEIFKVDGEVKYRTVGWKKAAMIFVKTEFAIGVLSIPSVLNTLGAVGGSILVICWGMLSMYGAIIMGDFRRHHRNIHTIVDAGMLMGGVWLKELIGFAYLLSFILCVGVSMLGVSIAFNAVTENAICTVWFTFIALVITLALGSFPKFGQIGILTWFGFASVFTAVLMIVIAVTTLDRPYAAPAGVTDFGFKAIAYPNFVDGMTASNTILVSYAATPAFMSAAAEMKRPQDYNKSVVSAMCLTTASYLAFSLVVYRWCGEYVASPALGSAGPLLKKIAYGIALPGLLVSACLYLHIAAKYMFVRILRNSHHLQEKTLVHHTTWYGSSLLIAVVAFILASSIPFFNSLLGLIVLFEGPISICVPMAMWFYDNKVRNRHANIFAQAVHGILFVVGAFVSVAGAYTAIKQIADQYAAGVVGSAFSCQDTSNTVG